MPIQVQVKRAGLRQQAMHQDEPGVKHIQIMIQVTPIIGVALRQLPFLGLARIFAAPHPGRVVPVREEWRIGVDQIDPPFIVGQ